MDAKTADAKLKEPIDFLFDVGKIIFLLIVLLYIIVHNERLAPILGYLPECVFHKVTGLDCPGCGMTRASIAIVKFEFIESIKFNVTVMYGFICYIVFMIVQTSHKYFGTKGFSEKLVGILIYIGVAVLILQFFIKIILCFTGNYIGL